MKLFKPLEWKDQLAFRGEAEMPAPEIEEFARKLIKSVRDSAIKSCDMNLRQDVRAAPAKRWRELGATDVAQAAEVLVPDSVDEAVFYVLNAIDQGILNLTY